LGVRDHLNGTGRLASQDEIAHVKPRQDGKGIKSTGSMRVELHGAGYREPGILRLREMRQLEVGPIQIAQELFGLQAVVPLPSTVPPSWSRVSFVRLMSCPAKVTAAVRLW